MLVFCNHFRESFIQKKSTSGRSFSVGKPNVLNFIGMECDIYYLKVIVLTLLIHRFDLTRQRGDSFYQVHRGRDVAYN